jgi:hypothetical protein
MIRLKCPTCGRTLGIDDVYVGKPALCPACQHTFLVPVPARLLDDTPSLASGERAGVSSPVGPPVSSQDRPLPPLELSGNRAAAEPVLPEGPLRLASERAWAPPAVDRASDGPSRCRDSMPATIPLAPDPPRPAAAQTGPVHDVSPRDLLPADHATAVSTRPWPDLSLDEAPAPATTADWSDLELAEALPAPDLEPIEEALEAPDLEPLDAIPAPEDEPLVEVFAAPAAPPSPPPPAALPQALPEAIPVDAITDAPRPVQALPEALPVIEPLRAPAKSVALDWGETPRREPRPSPAPKKKRRGSGMVSLIPGVEDYWLGLIFLAVLWVLLTVLVVLKPKLFWLPLALGGVVYSGGAWWFLQTIDEANPLWKIALVFVPLCALLYVWANRDRALRPFLMVQMGVLLIITGVAVLPAAFPRPPAVDPAGQVDPEP